jgi:hypothetical protein
MTFHRSAVRTLALSSFLVAFPLQAALAQEVDAVAERLKAVLAGQGIELTWSGVSGDASEMVISDANFTVTGVPQKTSLGNVTLSEITEENGAYTIGTVTLPNYSTTEEGATVDITGISLTGLKLPAEGDTDPIAALMLYESADMDSLTVRMGDKTPFSMNQLHFEITPPADGKAMEFTGAAEKFTADLSVVDDAESKKTMEALGYQTINGYFELAGSWQPSDGRLELSQYDISIENAGTIGFTFDLGGYTPDFIKSMQEMQKEMAKQPAGGDNSAQGLAMLGLMQQLTFHSASLRFDDDSLTGKVLDFIAAQQGVKAADLANQAKAIVPFLMAQLNNPELTTQVTAAVSAYLDEPKSIEVSAEPENAVPFAVIMAGAMSPTPQDLVKTLAVTVTANED